MRDLQALARNVKHIAPTLSSEDIAIILEAMGSELMGRAIWVGAAVVVAAEQLQRQTELAIPASQ